MQAITEFFLAQIHLSLFKLICEPCQYYQINDLGMSKNMYRGGFRKCFHIGIRCKTLLIYSQPLLNTPSNFNILFSYVNKRMTIFKRRQVASIGPNVCRSVGLSVEILFKNQNNQKIKRIKFDYLIFFIFLGHITS